jgi:hypothetical protein
MNKSLFPELETEAEKPIDRKVVDLVARTLASAPAPEADTDDWWSHNTDSVARCCYDDDDACVFIRPEHLKALIARLTTFLQERGR